MTDSKKILNFEWYINKPKDFPEFCKTIPHPKISCERVKNHLKTESKNKNNLRMPKMFAPSCYFLNKAYVKRIIDISQGTDCCVINHTVSPNVSVQNSLQYFIPFVLNVLIVLLRFSL